ncbi:hypothetical protein D5R40_02530 [Okeania hirsuta]|uniref:Uncharacterized protein n=1 Tax=Okeania hirsuta TaxID=1458930 RepID=A0A3N6PKV2_9CYAN|nr:hypothetical protein D4Z78_05580 [Okeania hirsuta]RQH55437.1 hypothetical protein D5R40_02530 [Okeania hirsuta]
MKESGVSPQESGGKKEARSKKEEEKKEKVFCLAGAQRTLTLRDRSSVAFRTENAERGTESYRDLIRT